MPFQKIQPEKLSTSVVRQIEQLILRGILSPGERLPAERELADRLGVSRPSLRDAISELQTRGLLCARAGSGVFIADMLGSAFSPALIQLFSSHHEAVFDYLSFRRDMEGLAAERAARLGSDYDLQVIQTCFDKMEAEQSPAPAPSLSEADSDLDAQFHSAIIDASHNVVMLHMMRSMFDLLRQGVFYNRKIMFHQHTSRGVLLDQHRAINAALQARDPAAARAAVEAHMDYVKQSLTDHQKAERNAAVAQLRLQHEAEKQ
ncbi:FCD domain-containing protein [Parasedimentitalea psychrophila]|uniref:Pyruvate dehydrogenase complex repressor n=1 Tax=Parasedimentitalea psychrophila TaxID=2997337 RepID=A0A9Y2L1C4_9RHOB|nr:FCD domain-containing protein [Parasedimentitalea psychrophila]WIY26503.1 FCD domain-containing protein [Parasedimentitalea psychrophila]